MSRAAIAFLALCWAPVFAAAAEGPDELERWVPSLAVYFDTLGQKAEGAIRTGRVMGPPLTTTDATGSGCLVTPRPTPFNPNPPPVRNGGLCPPPFGGAAFGSKFDLRPDTEGNDSNVVPGVGASLELMTPRLYDGALSPRLFLHGDAIATFAFERNVAGEGDPKPFFPPDLPVTAGSTPEVAVGGQGSRAKFQTRKWVVSAGLGVAFTTRVFNRTLRVKPSFEYLWEEVDLIGGLNRAVQLASPSAVGNLRDFRLISLTADAKEVLHGLGGGLELEVDSQRLGPLMASVFVMGRGYRFTGNLNHTLTATNEFGESASWIFEFDPWAWRGGIGVRFRWLPE